MQKLGKRIGNYLRVGIISCLCIFSVNTLLGQLVADNLIEYTSDYKFKDGIFLNHEKVKSNDPIPKARILTIVPIDDDEYYPKILANDFVFYYDNDGNQRTIKSEEVWGYSLYGILYVALDDRYHQIPNCGRICHFEASLNTFESESDDPYDYQYRYGGVADTPIPSKRQYVLDFDDGSVHEYKVKDIEDLLVKDDLLKNEYSELNWRKKRQQRFIYLMKFNERNPLYLPEY